MIFESPRSVAWAMRAPNDDRPVGQAPCGAPVCVVGALSRSSVYDTPQPVSENDLALMRRIDERHLHHPFAGARLLRDLLEQDGLKVGRRHVSTLMKKMGIEALY